MQMYAIKKQKATLFYFLTLTISYPNDFNRHKNNRYFMQNRNHIHDLHEC